ncbi:LacI family DNA-binding transcriptional regulator [Microbacterium dauci]|uniref:LacI family DNA-binding transcriptional regulator n=1 Tax=Microbacterium dauci TaxID=3048008 RepID=A0ABT6ZCW7_9MICO|nr:LacI family DNA-binding transcriptional regulator [Microbacterium sp. LX3-4]MDJ1113984.1 LacI family DNA-binding transcriptional regulator [Microbacterium sp. LX3-4]
MAGIDDVAAAAGVSAATVSRALSGRGRISDATRARVRAAAADLGYVVSSAASTLATGRTSNIGVVVPLLDRWFYANVIDGIAETLAARGYDVTLYSMSDDPAQRANVLDVSLRRGRVDGLIVLSLQLAEDELDRLLALELPVVGLGATSGRLPVLRIDDTAIARLATEHLLALGHRRIAHIGYSRDGDPGFDTPSLRRRGFEAAMADVGDATALFRPADLTLEDGHRAAGEVLDLDEPPTAIFAASDEMAFGAIFAARERGLDIPHDLSVVGVDGHEMGDFFGLTTVAQFPHAQGERAAATILGVVEDGADAADAALPFELVVRASTAAPAH